MTLEEALVAQLTGYAGLATLIGDRVVAMAVFETTILPAVTYQRISTTPKRHRGGYGLESIRYQLDGWATSYDQGLELRKEIRAAMFQWQRPSGPRVDATLLQDDRDLREAGAGRYRASIDFMLWATES